MNKRTIFVIAKKEFFSFLSSSLAYVIIVPFLILPIFLYLRNALAVGEANLRSYFEILFWFLLIIGPALSMKLISDEERMGTLELLFSHPISEIEIIFGKFLGALCFYLCFLVATLSLPITLLVFSRADIGQIFSQYLGGFLVGAVFIAIGIFASSLVRNAISAFLMAAAISFVVFIIGFDYVVLFLPFPFNRVASEISIFSHTQNLARGLIDFRDLFYFLTLGGLFLLIATISLRNKKTIEDTKEKAKMNLAVGILIGIGILANILFSAYPLRIDLTSGKVFTLSSGTKQTLKTLPDIVNITFYTSSTLPSQMQIVARSVSDLLKDYQRFSKNIRFKEVHPDVDSKALEEARSVGIEEITFNTISSGRFEAQTGYLGMTLRYGEKQEIIPFISELSDLEYQITRRIRKLTKEKENIVGLFENGFSFQDKILTELLETEYKIEKIGEGEKEKTKDISVLIVLDDGSQESTASSLIKDYLSSGGRVFYLGGGVNVNQQSLNAYKSNSKISDFLREFGVVINNDLVYDLQLNEVVSLFDGKMRYLLPYPFWIRTLPQENKFSPLVSVKSVTLGWPSSLKIDKKEGYNYRILLETSPESGKTEDFSLILPTSIKRLTSSQKEKIPLAVLIEKDNLAVVAVGTSTLAEDQFIGNNQDNFSFVSNIVDYLASEKEVASIPSKSLGRVIFEFSSPSQVLIVQWGNLLIPPFLVGIFAFWYLRRRKILTLRKLE